MEKLENIYQTLAAALVRKCATDWRKIVVAAPVLPTRCGGISVVAFDNAGRESDMPVDVDLVTVIDESFLAIRNEILQKSNKILWGINFCLERSGKFSLKFSYDKPSWFDEPISESEQDAIGWDLALFDSGSTTELDDQDERSAISWLKAATEKNAADWGLGSESNWAIDVPAGLITWVFGENQVKTAKVQFIGTWRKSGSEFQWAWANASIPVEFRSASEKLRLGEFYEERKEFSQARVVTSEFRAWAWAAMVGEKIGAQGRIE